MTGYYLTATMLDSYALWETQDWMTTQMLRDRLQRVYDDTPSIQRDVGIALHSELEPEPTSTEGIEFDQESLEAIRAQLPKDRVAEVKQYLRIDGHVVACKADWAHGLRVVDFKGRVPKEGLSSPPPFNADKHMEAWQWRAYMLAFKAKVFQYWSIPCRLDREGVFHAGEPDILPLFAYDGMYADVASKVRAIAQFIQQQELQVWAA
ncbi:MAG: hypothetical protein AAF184_09845 [Pseudomonadota bacterium]